MQQETNPSQEAPSPTQVNEGGTDSAKRRPTKNPMTRFLDLVGSIWFGITCLFIILIYCWVGSAGIPFLPARISFVRQYFEKTEMAWFSWWPFTGMLAIFCFSLTLVTLRKIPLRKVNYGVWTVHIGILILCLGSWIYFGTKIEGDAIIYRGEAVAQVGGGEPAVFRLQADGKATVSGGNKKYQISVVDLNPNYTLLTGDDKGKIAYAATLSVQPMEGEAPGERFMRQVIVGYPQYTEDVIPGKGRAIKVTGEKLVDQDLSITVRPSSVSRFHVKDEAALHVRKHGAKTWTEFPIEDLPRYKEYVTDLDDVWHPPHEKPTVRSLNFELEPKEDGPPLDAEASFRVVSYVPYAMLRERFVPGGERWNPWVQLRIDAMNQSVGTYEMLAVDPKRSEIEIEEGVFIRYRWVDDQDVLDKLMKPGSPELVVSVPSKGYSDIIPLKDLEGTLPLADTGYDIELVNIVYDWSLVSKGRQGEKATMAMIKVNSPDREQPFTRALIHPDGTLTQDVDEANVRHPGLLDSDLKIELRNVVSPGFVLVGGSVGTYGLLVNRGGQVEYRRATIGEPMEFIEGNLKVTVEGISETSEKMIQPQLTERREQNPKSLPNFSMIQVEIKEAGKTRTEWLEYSHYSHQNRIGYYPLSVRLATGQAIELLYSRVTHALPTPMSLETFKLEQFPGRTRERDYISLVKFMKDGDWTDSHEVRSNQPTEYDKWWYFQSTWDPPAPSLNYAGLNYTGIGVGNRNGVRVMLLGSILIMLGAMYAFYLKPLIRRRQQAALSARNEQKQQTDSVETSVSHQEPAALRS